MPTLDYYGILDISINANTAEVKKAYKRLALRYHPDKNSSSEAIDKFKSINEAYEVLSDPEKRSLYDHRHNVEEDYYEDNGDIYDYQPQYTRQYEQPQDVFENVFNHMQGYGAFQAPFNPYMMPMNSPIDPFGFNTPSMGHPQMRHPMGQPMGPPMMQNLPHFMPPHQNMMSSQHFGHQSFSSSSGSNQQSFSSSSGGGYSKSVSTSTRSVNGVVETVTVTKIVDQNGTNVIEEYSNGRTLVNGVEQERTNEIKVRRSGIVVLTDNDEVLHSEPRVEELINKTNRQSDDMMQRMLQELEARSRKERLEMERLEEVRNEQLRKDTRELDIEYVHYLIYLLDQQEKVRRQEEWREERRLRQVMAYQADRRQQRHDTYMYSRHYSPNPLRYQSPSHYRPYQHQSYAQCRDPLY